MQGPAGFFLFVYICCVVGVTVFLLALAWRFVKAHERSAESLEVIARHFRDLPKTEG